MIKVGDKFWSFDGNRRTYREDRKGGPIYEKHFYEVEIIGETSRSWIVGSSVSGLEYFKVTKSDPFRIRHGEFSQILSIFTDGMKSDRVWIKNHHRKLVERVERVSDIAVLKEIATLVDYQPSVGGSDEDEK